jgi:hypothetical protein
VTPLWRCLPILLLAAACTNASQDERTTAFANDTDPATTVRVSSKGSVSAAEVMALFDQGCLRSFPDDGRTEAALRRLGVLDYNADRPFDLRDVEGSISTSSLNGDVDYPDVHECRILAFVTDPESDWRSLAQDLKVPSGAISWNPAFSRGTYQIGEREMTIGISKPILADRANLGPVWGQLCGELPNCIAYGAVQLSVSYQRP